MRQRNRNKTMSKKKGENEGRYQFDKRRKYNKTLNKKSEKCREKNFNRRQEGTEDQGSGT
jgi:hypothetical protein